MPLYVIKINCGNVPTLSDVHHRLSWIAIGHLYYLIIQHDVFSSPYDLLDTYSFISSGNNKTYNICNFSRPYLQNGELVNELEKLFFDI